jgi:hypothetical protein
MQHLFDFYFFLCKQGVAGSIPATSTRFFRKDLHWVVAEDHGHVRIDLGKCSGEPVKRLLASRVARMASRVICDSNRSISPKVVRKLEDGLTQ